MALAIPVKGRHATVYFPPETPEMEVNQMRGRATNLTINSTT
jgi:hypothetical protein